MSNTEGNSVKFSNPFCEAPWRSVNSASKAQSWESSISAFAPAVKLFYSG